MRNDAKGLGEDIQNLYKAILTLQSEEDCVRFFEDLCTIQELKAMSQRMEVAKLLRKGGTYHEIAEATGASTATISRVNRCLIYGAEGYTTVLNRLEAQETQEK
ncbi:TrpR YerC/YecD [Christensenellaceae bacterium NSJ-44]|uniref:TrpR YerC/YecD n=1 Tax=Luoshenia tenuis TaxID=2763654 RepID=A0A926HLT0_9FIRM|nr:YerC/YecD family TrpR-related protein [Clostridium sp. BSD2780061688st1 E8]MBC8528784.1 TrpR YerC/YecD [Luoshenia tenuis]SCJ24907.1 Uncharacterized protein conserved in bacteria [uncultured Clostridium sp.]